VTEAADAGHVRKGDAPASPSRHRGAARRAL